MSTITSANSIFMLSAVDLYNVPVQIQGYAADDAFASEEVEFGESVIGVDRKASFGFTPYLTPLDFTLQADSASILIMEAIIAEEKASGEKIILNATIILPGIGRIYAFSKGGLMKGPVGPSAGKVLKPRKYALVFEDLSSAPV